MTMTSLEDILSIVSSLAMEGCIFMGELPGMLLGAELGDMVGLVHASSSLRPSFLLSAPNICCLLTACKM